MTSKNSVSADIKQQSTSVQPQIQEYSIRVPKNNKKKYNVMRFNAVSKVNFKEWKQVKIARENNLKSFKEAEEDIPKFGAGSEFGREAREEARKKRFGLISKKYRSEDQPWVLKVNGRTGRQFRGIREGGISANASYYVFTHAPDGAIEAFPLNEWYNFQPVQKFKPLSAEEAEEEFNRRTKTMNFFNFMLKKRLRNDEDDNEEGDMMANEKKRRNSKKSKDLIISDLEECIVSDEEYSGSDENEEKKNNDILKKKKKAQNQKKKKNLSCEAYDESDEADDVEVDYMSSDSSNSEFELELQKEEKSVAEEDGLRKILASDDEDDEDEDQKNEENKNNDDGDKDNDLDKAAKSSEKKKDKKKNKEKDTSDSSNEFEIKLEQNKDNDVKKVDNLQNSRSVTPTLSVSNISEPLKKNPPTSLESSPRKFKLENNHNLPTSSFTLGSSDTGITEDAVRRYLMRKPMTTTELLQKFKNKKTGLSSEQIVTIMTKILKNINPLSRKIKDKMYFSIKPQLQR